MHIDLGPHFKYIHVHVCKKSAQFRTVNLNYRNLYLLVWATQDKFELTHESHYQGVEMK